MQKLYQTIDNQLKRNDNEKGVMRLLSIDVIASNKSQTSLTLNLNKLEPRYLKYGYELLKPNCSENIMGRVMNEANWK